MKKIITVLIGFGFIVAAYMYYEKPCYFVQPQRDHLICLLNNSKHHAIENYFSALQKSYVNKTVTEDDIWNAFMIFESSDLSLEPYLEKWLLKYPDSFAANQALGTFYEHLGWLSRGTKWKKDTRDEQSEAMLSYFNKAEKYFLRAAEIEQKVTLPYVGLIRMYKTSNKEKMKQAMLKGLQIDKASYYIRYYYLFGLQPKWGGSIEELRDFFDETLTYSDTNPKLKSLEGFLYFVIGDVKSYHDDDIKNPVIVCKTSKSNLDRAIALGDNPLFYSRRGNNNVCLKQYDEAVNDYNSALKLDPESVPYRIDRGYTYGKLKEYKLALADLDWAISRDPLNPTALVYRARIHSELKNTEQALRDYKASLYFDKDNKHVHRNMGNVNFFQTKNYKESINNLNKAIELGDDSPLVYLLLSMAQYNVLDCGFIANTKTYLKLCKKSSCESDHLRWVKQSVAAVKTSNMCQ